MTQTKDDNELEILEKEIREFRTTFKTTCYGGSIDQTLGLRDQWLKSISKLTDKWSMRLKEGDLMINRFQEYTNELNQKNKSIEEKQEKLSEVLASIKDGEEQNSDLTDTIQELKEKLIRIGETKSKATEEKMERLSKVEKTFKERTGLEIRKTSANHLQFIFRRIDHKDPDKPYICTLSLNEEGAYEVISCSPPLGCIEELQLKVRETNNFSAFIANIRKAFIALSYK
ncbi:kinetochore protein Spc25 [Heteronotia binoei]|uniref:kinetochore protein Spc25 n=1 Tax=Heteronotia binoei TaxID=13085 RepID=UPI00292D49BC|nr:kinetochore protein Spc25 [Heteronotia binoei]XP_060113255.1 kinetochore protein Spc25 [Heteronotia binoei]XP_060113256.1 kinetochore protein Spc25 [Heteronotia binoei]XP_060113257.1 kinetochore protein Spc25 [Heteronotia binoei]XP_060113258.1 kinetochore protein Spc25 [Heteronotia binoei]